MQEAMSESEKAGQQLFSGNNTTPATNEAPDSSPTGDRPLGNVYKKERPEELTVAKEEEGTEEEAKASKGSIKDFFRIFRYTDRLDASLYAVSFACAIISGAALPLMALLFGSSSTSFNDYASGRAAPAHFQNTVNTFALYFVYLFVGRFVISYIGNLCICVAAARTTNSLRKAFLESLLRKDISHFDMQGNGSVATQVTTNGNRVNAGIAEKLYNAIQGASLFFSAFIVALAVQPVLAIITMSIVPGIVLGVGGSIALDTPIEARITRIYSHAATIAQDALGSVKTMFAFGAGQKIVQQYEADLKAAHEEGKKKSLIYGTLFSCQYFFVLSGIALAFWQGFRMFQSGQISSAGTVLTVVLGVTVGATSVISFMPSIMTITNAISSATELFSVMDKKSIMDPLSTEGERPMSCTGEIEFRNVQFAYPTRPTATVLQDLSLSIPAGKTTALVGPSGCGKSTVVGLLERWYQPTSGDILIDGRSVSDLNTNWIRSNIRLVQQEPTLFTGSVFQNVAKGFVGDQHNLTEQDQMKLVAEACNAADAHAFISLLPEGYHTQIGERGGMLSGGQLQRISIARSIISNPKVLLCDEATSALDPRAEAIVQEALRHASENKTTLIIAHKLATVMAADSIAVMNSGKVVEQGSHSELIERDGLYAAMVRAQDLGNESIEQDTPPTERKSQDTYDKDVRDLQLQRTQSESAVKKQQDTLDYYSAGTLGYSLFKCIIIMLKENRAMYPWYMLISASYIMVGGTYPAQAVLFSRLINVFTLEPAEGKRQADLYALMFFVLALANLVGYFCVGIATNVIGQAMTHRYRREMLEHMVSFDLDFFDCPENSSGALTAKLSSVPAAVQELMSGNLGLILTVVVNVISTSALGIAFGWKLGLALVFGGLTVIVGSGFVRVRVDQQLEARTEKQFTKGAGLASEAVGAIRTVSLLTMESSVLNEYKQVLDGIVSDVVRSLIPTLIPYVVSQSAEFLVLALGFWYGSRLVASGEYTTTQFFVIFIAVVFGGQSAAQLFTWTTSLTKATGNINYILWLRTISPSIRDTDENRDRGPSGNTASIEAENLQFRYKQRSATNVLQGISLKIKANSYVAFVGPSGCGKSTIVSLLERFYDPTSGRLSLNGDDISHMSPTLYRRYMSLVLQNPPLYQGSVRENISIGLNYEPSDDEIRTACEQANAQEFIASLPEGLGTLCGARGLQFSGGQRQRIAVARALIRKPRLLLLDEATSALDTQSERIVQEALNKAASGRTTVAVAHRLSTIRNADRIYVIEDGKIAEMGTHEELQGSRGKYHAMCVAQSLDQS